MKNQVKFLFYGMITCFGLIAVGCSTVPVSVNGTIEILAGDCDITPPNEALVTIEIWSSEKDDPANRKSNSQNVTLLTSNTFPQSGTFSIIVQFPSDLPTADMWRIVSVTRSDKSEICTSDSCGSDTGQICQNVNTNPGETQIGNPIQWAIGCKCISSSN